jgi:peptide chain release factor 1
VRCESERSARQNRETALAILRARLFAREREQQAASRAAARRQQIGSGMRGDKRRTIRVQDGTVTDHLTGRTWSFRDYERGNW